MALIDSLANRFGYVKADKLPGWAKIDAENARWNMPDGYSALQQEQLYRVSSWVHMAVSMIATQCAAVELEVARQSGKGDEDIVNHPFELLLHAPNPSITRFAFLEASYAYYALTGNCYWWVNAATPNAPPSELWIVPPDKIAPIPDGRLYISGYKYEGDGGGTIRIPPEEIVHIKKFHPTNPFVGLSPVEAIMATATGDIKMTEWNTNFFAENNAKPAGALVFHQNYPDTTWTQIKDNFKSKHGGTRRNMALMQGVPKDGLEWIQFGISQKDMEFLAARKFNQDEICKIFGVPLGLIDANATEANATVAKASFAEGVLWPTLTAFSEAITHKVLPRYGDDLIAEFDDPRISDRVLELDQRKTWALYRTIDELRAEDGLEPIGDERGQLLIAEVGASKAAPPAPFGPDNKPSEVATPTPTEQPPAPEDTAPDVSMMMGNLTQAKAQAAGKQAVDELYLWRKKSLRMFAQKGVGVCAFDSAAIEPAARNRIAYGLAQAGDTGAIKATFDKEIHAIEGETSAAIIELASAIRRASGLLQGAN